MTPSNRIFMLSSLAFALIAATSLQAADRALTGNWEFKMTTNGQTTTATQCVTQEMAAASNGDTKSARAAAEKAAKGRCTFDSYDVTGDTVRYTMNCGGTVMESSGTYHGDTMTGVLKTTRQGKQSTTSVSGHRLGACPATQGGKR
jgi:hypothetical protein